MTIFPATKSAAGCEAGWRKKRKAAECSTQAAAVQEHDVVGEAPGLAEIVRDHDDLGAARGGGEDELLDGEDGGRVEARRRLVEEQDLGLDGEGARQRQALLLAARHHAGRRAGEIVEPRQLERAAHERRPLVPRHAVDLQRVGDVGGGGAAQQHRPLEDHGLAPANLAVGGAAGEGDAAGRRADQPVQDAHEQALAGAVRPHDHRPGAAAELEVDAVEQAAPARLEDEALAADRQPARLAVRRGTGRVAAAIGHVMHGRAPSGCAAPA